MRFDPGKPFNDLPLLPPAADMETRAVLKKSLSAGRMLAELKGLGGTIPNQSVLINSLTLQEAKASSEIENVITTNDALFKAFSASTSQVDPATKEVLRYREALWEGFNILKAKPLLTTNLLVRLVQIIKKNEAGIRNVPGTQLANPATGETMYTPPEGEELLRDKLKNLEDYIHSKEGPDPLIKVAAIHYQFESIHPFFDGNGRVGRILCILYLVQQGLLDLPVLYLSRYIIQEKGNYYRLLRNVTQSGQWESWVLFMLEAIEQTAASTRERILAIRDLMLQTMERCKKDLPGRVYSKELIELLFRQPYTKGRFLVEAGIAQRKTAAGYLKALEEIGVLESQRIGKEVLYLNRDLYELLSREYG
jgi:Fic family protein